MILKDAYNHILIEKIPYEPFHFPRSMTLFWLVDCGLALRVLVILQKKIFPQNLS